MLSDYLRPCCNTPANESHLPGCTDPIEPLPEQQREQGVDLDDDQGDDE
jgi:hypothetical protein